MASGTMKGVVLPGNSTVQFRDFPIPEPGRQQVLVRIKASTICGSDIRAIYREHLGKGPEAYQGVISGHEPCGQIELVGQDCRRFKKGDRVILYHISGCGVCHDCRMGYRISCSSSARGAYGWQRDGGNAEFCLAEESDLVLLPDSMSYIDGACVACGFGTCYEAISRMQVSGDDIGLVVGLGPMGLASLMLLRARGATKTIGVDIEPERILLAKKLGIGDVLLSSNEETLTNIKDVTNGKGAEVSIDCSGSEQGRLLAIKGTAQWGRCAFVGEGGKASFEPSPTIIHNQITVFGSWVTSLANMERLVERMVRWDMHPEITCTHKYPLSKAQEAYTTMNQGKCGKVAIGPD